jgi:hypothetical protein
MKCPYKFPLRSRDDIIGFLTSGGRSYFTFRTGYAPLTWNIKVYSYDKSGLNHGQPYCSLNRDYDDGWAQWLQETANRCTGETNEDQLFWRACEDGLRYFLEGDYTIWPGDEADATFAVLGRSGGYLCLKTWNGHQLWHYRNGGREDFEQFLGELPYRELRQLYKLVVSLDQDIKPDAEVSHQFSFYRSQWEEDHTHELAMEFPHRVPGNYTCGAFI